VDCANDGDAAGISALYEEQAVMAYPPGSQTVGRDAIRALWENVRASAPRFEQETTSSDPVNSISVEAVKPPRSLVVNGGGGRRAERSGG
jgi:hypothetical protein